MAYKTITTDKALHFLAGFIIVLIFYIFIYSWSIFVVIAFALAKEAYDLFDDETRKDVELLDIFFTIIGGQTALLILGW